MLEELKLDLEEVKAEVGTIKRRQARLEDAMQAFADTPIRHVTNILFRLRRLIADGKANPDHFRSLTGWAEVEDCLEALSPLKRQLPGRLFWCVWLALKDSRRRLEANRLDAYAVNQLEYVTKVLANLFKQLQCM
jgi:hypothetical protein